MNKPHWNAATRSPAYVTFDPDGMPIAVGCSEIDAWLNTARQDTSQFDWSAEDLATWEREHKEDGWTVGAIPATKVLSTPECPATEGD